MGASLRRCRRLVWVSTLPRFEAGIYDENHNCRNPRNTYARVMALIKQRSIVMVSATPCLNRVEDVRGIASQAEQMAGLKMSSLPDTTDWEYLLSSDFQPWRDETDAEGRPLLIPDDRYPRVPRWDLSVRR